MEKIDKNFRLTLRYGLISFFAVGIAAVCILLLFRYQTIQIIKEASRRSNEAVTIATEYSLNDHFVLFINYVSQNSETTNTNLAQGPAMSKAIQKLLLNTSVVRLKIYDTAGTVIYSTKSSQIGSGQEHNEGFRQALEGEVASVLIYRDSFNLFDKEYEDTNLVQTYVPIKLVTTGEVVGVFEVYSDVSDYIYLSDRAIFLVSIVVLLGMFVLYAFLLMHIKRSENIINDQSKETQERNRMLEYLTAKMINAQEDERRRIAYDLHEDVVQTISGVKMQLERYIASLTEDKAAQVDADVTESIVPVLQEAAQKIRMVAIDLRPPSLDDFGLKAAINTLMTECRALKTEMAMTFDVRINESDLTTERRSILYRMLKDALKSLCSKYIARGTVKITLDMLENRLILVFNVTGLNDQDLGPETIPVYLESVQERTILSGGQFDLKRIGSAIESVSSWHV